MKEYVQGLFDKSPFLRKQILSMVSKHMTGKVALLNDFFKAIYDNQSINHKLAYQALYRFIKESLDGRMVLPRPEYIRTDLKKEIEEAKTPVQMLYRDLEIMACEKLDDHLDTQTGKIEKALEYMLSCALAYENAYSLKKVKLHADKIDSITNSLSLILGSSLTSFSVKFKEVQRLLKMEIEHKKLKTKEDKYLSYLEDGLSRNKLKDLLSSQDFIESDNTFAKALLGILKYSERLDSEIGLSEKLEAYLNDDSEDELHSFDYMLMLRKDASNNLFSQFFSSRFKESYESKLMSTLLTLITRRTELSDDDHKEIYQALRDYLTNTKDKSYQAALTLMLSLEDKMIDDVIRHVIVFEEAQHVMNQFEGLVIPQEVIEKKIDKEEQQLLAYTVNNALRTIISICSNQKDLSEELSSIINSRNINALEKISDVTNVFFIRGESKLSAKDIPNLEEELADYDYRVLGDNGQKILLLRSMRGLNEGKAREYVARALQSVIASYKKAILSKFPEIDYVPELKAEPTSTTQRTRAMSTILRDRFFVPPVSSEEASISPKMGSPASSSLEYDPTLFGKSKSSSGSNTPDEKSSPTHS